MAEQQPFRYANAGHSRQYREIHALLLYWKDDDLDAIDEIMALQRVFDTTYHFSSVEYWDIPSEEPYIFVERIMDDFKRHYSDLNNLLIVYYSSHGHLDDNKHMIFSPYNDVKESRTPELEWYALQIGLEHAVSDVLIILDCCSAGAALLPSDVTKFSASKEGGVTELLAASHFNLIAPGIGEVSFTSSLISALKALAERKETFSSSDLYRGILQHISRTSGHQQIAKARNTCQCQNDDNHADGNNGDDNRENPPSQRSSPELPTPVHLRLDGHTSRPNIPLRAFNPQSNHIREIQKYRERAKKRSASRFEDTIPWPTRNRLFPPPPQTKPKKKSAKKSDKKLKKETEKPHAKIPGSWEAAWDLVTTAESQVKSACSGKTESTSDSWFAVSWLWLWFWRKKPVELPVQRSTQTEEEQRSAVGTEEGWGPVGKEEEPWLIKL